LRIFINRNVCNANDRMPHTTCPCKEPAASTQVVIENICLGYVTFSRTLSVAGFQSNTR